MRLGAWEDSEGSRRAVVEQGRRRKARAKTEKARGSVEVGERDERSRRSNDTRSGLAQEETNAFNTGLLLENEKSECRKNQPLPGIEKTNVG